MKNIILDKKESVIVHKNNVQVIVNNHVVEPVEIAEKGTVKMNQLVIPYGKTSKLVLPDSSVVFLNAGSRLVYPDYFADKNREVFLVGEALFEFKHNLSQKFTVKTSNINVIVEGTKFNVSAYPSDNIIETVLTEGKVKLENIHGNLFSTPYEIEPGQMAVFNKTDGTTKVKTLETENYTLWKDGFFKFEVADLSRVIKKLERYFNIRFQYEDPLLGSIRISGKLELTQSKEIVIENVARAANVKITKTENEYYKISE